MSNLWIARPSNAESLPCRNDQNCHFLKNGHCWYYHPPHHHTYNQRNHDRQWTTSNNSRNPASLDHIPHYNQLWNSRPNNDNMFNPTHMPSRYQNYNPTRNRGNYQDGRRRQNRRQNRAVGYDTNSRLHSHDSYVQSRSAPVIHSPVTKRTRPEIETVISPIKDQSLNNLKDITIEAFQCPISMEVRFKMLYEFLS